MTLSSKGVWQAAQSVGISTARNATPLAVIYNTDGVTTTVSGRIRLSWPCQTNNRQWYLFYVDTGNFVQNVYYSSTAGAWVNGTVGTQHIRVPRAQKIALTAIFGIAYNSTSSSTYPYGTLDGGLSLCVSGEDGLIHEYTYNDSTSQWTAGYAFSDSNAYSDAYIDDGGSKATYASYQ